MIQGQYVHIYKMENMSYAVYTTEGRTFRVRTGKYDNPGALLCRRRRQNGGTMSVGAIQSGTSYSAYDAAKKTSEKKSTGNVTAKNEEAAVYESSVKSSDKNAVTKKMDSALVAKLKADSENRINQMQSLVEKMFQKQGITIGTADDMWKQLASGNFTADAETIAQAKEDISEDGYWGVNQTSDRIFDFAMALSGGDEEKMQQMKEAVEKGFKMATKSWGQDLPDISNKTYDSVMKKFDDFFNKGEDDTTATGTEA